MVNSAYTGLRLRQLCVSDVLKYTFGFYISLTLNKSHQKSKDLIVF